MTTKEALHKIKEIGMQRPDYDFCSFNVNNILHQRGIITGRATANIFFKNKNGHLTGDGITLEEAISDLKYKVENSIKENVETGLVFE